MNQQMKVFNHEKFGNVRISRRTAGCCSVEVTLQRRSDMPTHAKRSKTIADV